MRSTCALPSIRPELDLEISNFHVFDLREGIQPKVKHKGVPFRRDLTAINLIISEDHQLVYNGVHHQVIKIEHLTDQFMDPGHLHRKRLEEIQIIQEREQFHEFSGLD